MDALSLHYYTVPGEWAHKGSATGFDAARWARTLQVALRIDDRIAATSAIMDRYDPAKRVALFVDEWGLWHDPEPGTNGAFLFQQNTLRDALVAALTFNVFHRHTDRVRMANIAQMINVLQSMILTDKEKMVRTPTYYVYKMYVPFQDASFVPVSFDAGAYTHGDITLPRVDAIAAKGKDGKLWLEITNIDPNQPVEIEASVAGIAAKSATGETLTAPRVDSINTFDAPNSVVPEPIAVKVQGGKLSLKLEPKSITVISVE
jgi:alpha-N-arabinofuranosidase